MAFRTWYGMGQWSQAAIKSDANDSTKPQRLLDIRNATRISEYCVTLRCTRDDIACMAVRTSHAPSKPQYSWAEFNPTPHRTAARVCSCARLPVNCPLCSMHGVSFASPCETRLAGLAPAPYVRV